ITIRQVYSGVLTGTYTQTIVLTNPATQNPFTVASGGSVSVSNRDALFGNAAAAWNVSNFGRIAATGSAGTGVELTAGGTVTNASGAVIAGVTQAVYITGGPGTVQNSGGIASYGGFTNAVYLQAGGTVANQAGALISGPRYGVLITGSSGTVANFGSMIGGQSGGVVLGKSSGATSYISNGYILNAAGGRISGQFGAVSLHGSNQT